MLVSLGRGLAPAYNGHAGPSLHSVMGSCLFDLDATHVGSYSGTGQSWSNITDIAGYNFWRGDDGMASTDDPHFEGLPGSKEAYFLMDGSDCFRLAGDNTDFLSSLHKTSGGNDWWFALAYKPVAATEHNVLLGNQPGGASPGILIYQRTTNLIYLQQRGDNAAVSRSCDVSIVPDEDTLLIISYSGGNVRAWANERTKTETAFTPDVGITEPLEPTLIGARSGSLWLEDGARLYGVAMGNAFIDDADAARIFDFYNARHGRVYA